MATKIYRIKNKISGAVSELNQSDWDKIVSRGWKKKFDIVDVLTSDTMSPKIASIKGVGDAKVEFRKTIKETIKEKPTETNEN